MILVHITRWGRGESDISRSQGEILARARYTLWLPGQLTNQEMIMRIQRVGLAATLLLGVATAAWSQEGDWGYEGDVGPENWASLDPAYAVCDSGKNQSPVDIDVRTNVVDAKLPAIHFNYTMLTPQRIINTGLDVEVEMRSGGEIELDGKTFALKRFVFHGPSETMINGESFPMEIEFIHEDDQGEVAIVSMLLSPGAPHPTVDKLFMSLPPEAGLEAELPSWVLQDLEKEWDEDKYFRYNGSLTTPPCSEGVRWIVLRTPVTVSKPQVDALAAVLGHPNNRPVQPINARRVMK